MFCDIGFADITILINEIAKANGLAILQRCRSYL